MKKRYYFLWSFFLLIFLIAGVIFAISFFKFLSVKKTISALPEYSSEEYLRIKIYGSSYNDDGNTISGNFSLINENGLEIAVIERSWSGPYLAVDFKEIKMADKSFSFPEKIYGRDELLQYSHKPNKGTSLGKYYNENGEFILLGNNSTKMLRKKYYKIASFALGKNIFSLKYKKTVTIDLSSCINGKYYSIVRVPSGNYLLREL